MRQCVQRWKEGTRTNGTLDRDLSLADTINKRLAGVRTFQVRGDFLSSRQQSNTRSRVQKEDLVPDQRLTADQDDLLDHDAIAKTVASVAWEAEAPVNIALFGAWGSGKSSIYDRIDKHLAEVSSQKAVVARYDAWKYGGKELKRNFIESLSATLDLDDHDARTTALHSGSEEESFKVAKWVKAAFKALLPATFLAFCVATLLMLILTVVDALVRKNKAGFLQEMLEAVPAYMPAAATLMAALLVAYIAGPKILGSAFRVRVTAAPDGADQFAAHFAALVTKALKKGTTPFSRRERLVVFIDELDRCSPEDVVATLVDLKTFLDQPNCVFIVAADRAVIQAALDAEVPQSTPHRPGEPYYATSGAFLDKIFQHQLALPPLRSRALTNMARELVADRGGIWKELKDHELLDKVIFALIPVHVRSPRRVKVLLNNYATNVRIAEARAFEWLDRAEELAVLTVLQTEFPALAEDLRRVPRLLEFIRQDEVPVSDDAKALARTYMEEVGAAGSGMPVDPDTSEDAGAEPDDLLVKGKSRAQAASDMRHQLRTYLGKITHAKVADPRPDLFYLQVAGGREGLQNERLGDAIDMATGMAPQQVVEAFTGAVDDDIVIAVPLLFDEGEEAFGKARTFAYEAACRLMERLPEEALLRLVPASTPTVLTALARGEIELEGMHGALKLLMLAGESRKAVDVLEQIENTTDGPEERKRMLELLHCAPEALLADVFWHLEPAFRDEVDVLTSAIKQLTTPALAVIWGAKSNEIIKLWASVDSDAEGAEEDAALIAPELVPAFLEGLAARSDSGPLRAQVMRDLAEATLNTPQRKWVDDEGVELVADLEDLEVRVDLCLRYLQKTWHGSRWWETATSVRLRAPSNDLRISASEVLRSYLSVGVLSATMEEAEAFATRAAWLADLAGDSESYVGWVTDLIDDSGWDDRSHESASGSAFWSYQRSLTRLVSDLPEDEGATAVEALGHHLAEFLGTSWVNEQTLNQWLTIVDEAPVAASVHAIREMGPGPNAHAERAVLLAYGDRCKRLELPWPSAEQLNAFSDEALDDEVLRLWLSSSPSLGDIMAFRRIGAVPIPALSEYAQSLPCDDRTQWWLDWHKAEAYPIRTRSLGKCGVGSQVIPYLGAKALEETTAPARRSELASLLELKLDSSDAAASQVEALKLVRSLLGKGTKQDLELAGEILHWAGGAPRGEMGAARSEFKAAQAKCNPTFKKDVQAWLLKNQYIQKSSAVRQVAKRLGF